MTRLAVLLVVLGLLAGAVAPAVASAHPERAGMPATLCPMMDHSPHDEPCIGAPCPCHGAGDRAGVLPDGVRLAMPEAGNAVRNAATSGEALCLPMAGHCLPGYAGPPDHPPDPRS